jgi:hypothetical protein
MTLLPGTYPQDTGSCCCFYYGPGERTNERQVFSGTDGGKLGKAIGGLPSIEKVRIRQPLSI